MFNKNFPFTNSSKNCLQQFKRLYATLLEGTYLMFNKNIFLNKFRKAFGKIHHLANLASSNN
jgi:hypothetical protein